MGRQRGPVLEQAQLIAELRLLQAHVDQLDTEIAGRLAQSREGQILTSIPGAGSVVAAGIISAIGHIENFPSAAALKSYFGWAPTLAQTGTMLDAARLKPGGSATMKELVFMMVANASRLDSEWARLYARLVPIKCGYDERTQRHTGKVKVMGRIASQLPEQADLGSRAKRTPVSSHAFMTFNLRLAAPMPGASQTVHHCGAAVHH